MRTSIKILLLIAVAVAFTACGPLGISAKDPSALSAQQLPIIYYAQVCSSSDTSNSTYWCKNPPSTTTTGTNQ